MTEQAQERDVEGTERSRMQAHELSWALRAVVRATADVDRTLAGRLGLRPLDYAAVNLVMTSEEPLGPVDLSARLGISTGSGTELVDRLERSGHLHRERHPSDRRRIVLRPTPEAVTRILGTLEPLFGALDGLAEEFTPDEQAVVGRYLRDVEARLERYRAAPP